MADRGRDNAISYVVVQSDKRLAKKSVNFAQTKHCVAWITKSSSNKVEPSTSMPHAQDLNLAFLALTAQ